MYCVMQASMQASVPSLYNVYRRYDTQLNITAEYIVASVDAI